MLTIRKFFRHFTTEELLERGALTQESLNVILAAVQRRKQHFGLRRHVHRQDNDHECFCAASSAARTDCRHRKAGRDETRSEVRAQARGVPDESATDRKCQCLSCYR